MLVGGRYMRFVWCGNFERDRYIMYYIEYIGYSYFSVWSLRDCMYIKRGMYKVVVGMVCVW